MNPTDDPRGPVPDADPLDELASAVLDGEATPGAPDLGGPDIDGAALAARVAAFQRVARVVGAPVEAVDDDQREAAIATALAAWGMTAPDDEPAIVTDLAAARSRRHSTGLWVAGIAAAVAGVVAFGGLALRSGDDAEDTATSASSEETESAETFGDDALATEGGSAGGDGAEGSQERDQDQSGVPSSAAGAPTAAEPGDQALPAGDLGDFVHLEDLFDAALAQLQPGERVVAAFPDAGCAAAEPDGTTATATARLDGEPVVVALVEDGDARVVQIYDAATCRLMAERLAS